MGRYAISGSNSTLLDATEDATGVSAGDPTTLLAGRDVMGRTLPSSRTLYLRSFWAFNASTAITLRLFDASAGTNPTQSTTRMKVRCASVQLTMVDIPAPGIKFATGCVVSKEVSDASAGFQPGDVGGAGYEEG